MTLKNTFTGIILVVAGLMLSAPIANAHCQVPCGIFDDHMRVDGMLEDAETIAKAARLINELSGKTDPQSTQQLVRWVMNKESHAQKIIETISDYYLTQRVKTDMDDYEDRLIKHHAVMIMAMKAKQQTTEKAMTDLVASIKVLLEFYPDPHHHHHH